MLTPEIAVQNTVLLAKDTTWGRGRYLIYLDDLTDLIKAIIPWNPKTNEQGIEIAARAQSDHGKDRLTAAATQPDERGGLFITLTIGSRPRANPIKGKRKRKGERLLHKAKGEVKG